MTTPAQWNEVAELRARVAALEGALDRDLTAMLKGAPITTPPPYGCCGPDQPIAEYYRNQAQMASFAAVRALKVAESYRQKAVAIQRAADIAADQASAREKKLRAKIDALAVQP